MKLSNCLALAALTLSVSAYAQNSQTFNFGEGQTTPHQADGHAQADAPHGQPSHAPKHKTTYRKPAHHAPANDNAHG